MKEYYIISHFYRHYSKTFLVYLTFIFLPLPLPAPPLNASNKQKIYNKFAVRIIDSILTHMYSLDPDMILARPALLYYSNFPDRKISKL